MVVEGQTHESGGSGTLWLICHKTVESHWQKAGCESNTNSISEISFGCYCWFFNVSSLGCPPILVCSQIHLMAGLLRPTTDIPVNDEFLDSLPLVRDPPLDPDPTSDEMCAKWSFRLYLPINFADNTSFDNVAHLSICNDLTSDRLLISTKQFLCQLPQSVKDTCTSSKFQAVYDILENRIPVEEKVTIFVSHSSLVPGLEWLKISYSVPLCLYSAYACGRSQT